MMRFNWTPVVGLLAIVVLLVWMIDPAWSQDVPAPVEECGALCTLGNNLFETVAATLMVLIGGLLTWVSNQVSKWTAGRVKLDELAASLKWEEYAEPAVQSAFAYARRKSGLDPAGLNKLEDKVRFLDWAMVYMNAQYADLMKEWDKDQNGAIDWLESKLPATSPALKRKPRAPAPEPVA